MLRSRIVPCLLVHDKGLVKTVNFKDPKYVGDPINAVRIFNEKEVDELMVLDIDASVQNKEPDFNMIKNIAMESRMPLCYGGGVTSVAHVMKIISLGAEKVAISSAAISNPNIIRDMVKAVGSQSVIVVLDAKKKLLGGYEVYIHNGKKSTGMNVVDLAKKFEELGAGEIVINSIDQDGVMKGLDYSLCDKIRQAVNIPLTFLGGIGNLNHIGEAIKKYKTIGISAGSLFVFKGVYKAVLINYPSVQERKQLYNILK